jgi:hypothetical protein
MKDGREIEGFKKMAPPFVSSSIMRIDRKLKQ